MTRSLPEWCGKTDDAMPPPRVRLRIFNKHEGICHISKRKIAAGERWQLDHILALIDGGKNVESNFAPALTDPHKDKTAAEVKRKAKIDAQAKFNLGIKSDKPKMQGPVFNPATPQRRASRPLNKQLPPRTSVAGQPI